MVYYHTADDTLRVHSIKYHTYRILYRFVAYYIIIIYIKKFADYNTVRMRIQFK